MYSSTTQYIDGVKCITMIRIGCVVKSGLGILGILYIAMESFYFIYC